MILSKVEFYQAVALPIKTKSNFNTVSSEVVPGITIEVNDHLVTMMHKDWSVKVIVPTANVRFMYEELPKEIKKVVKAKK
jgi:hypothetical protein